MKKYAILERISAILLIHLTFTPRLEYFRDILAKKIHDWKFQENGMKRGFLNTSHRFYRFFEFYQSFLLEHDGKTEKMASIPLRKHCGSYNQNRNYFRLHTAMPLVLELHTRGKQIETSAFSWNR